MASYVSSTANRWYTALEASYGQVPQIDARNRIPAVKLTAKLQWEKRERRDKTGSRTFPGLPVGLRRRVSFALRTYMTSWGEQVNEPSYGPLFKAALGGTTLFYGGGTAAEGCTAISLRFVAPHGLVPGQAVTVGEELRFVSSVADERTVVLNAPLSMAPSQGTAVGRTVTYQPGSELPSVSIFDYWSPTTAVQRILCGAAVDKLRIRVNGDYHEFEFSGLAGDLIDNVSFASGQGALTSFPEEPQPGDFDYTVIPGNVGQAWLGPTPERFWTLAEAEVLLDNQIEPRDREFGSAVVKGVWAGVRSVTADLDLYELDDEATKALYQAAKQRSPISLMFQLGNVAGQMFGVYLKGVVPEVPEFDDSDARLRWRFSGCRAQGTLDDEIYVAFG